jgi:uroporphyrinogen decarboxylase
VLRSGDDVANQRAMTMSPESWRHFIRSRWARVYEAARAEKPDIEIWYHTDGNPEAILDELVDIGVTILNPVQPECIDPARVKRRYGSRLVLDGTIGTQSTMPWGTPEDVRRVVAERVETLAGDGALILAPTHTLEPEVPIENVLAFAEAAGTYGAR